MIRRVFPWVAMSLLMVGACLSAGAVETRGFGEEITEARALFLEAVDGGPREVRRALRRFRALRATYPDNPVVQAYLGGCVSLQARDARSGVNAQRFAEEALQQTDTALGRLPEISESVLVLETRLVAAYTLIHVPPFLNRFDQGEALIEDLLSDPGVEEMPPAFRAAVYFAAALAARQRGQSADYRRHLHRTVEIDPDGRDGRRAAELLAQEGL